MRIVLRRLAAVLACLSMLLVGPGVGAASASGPGCNSDWRVHYTVNLAPGYWSEGKHTYEIRVTENGVVTLMESGGFRVEAAAALHRGEVFFRRGGTTPYTIDGHADSVNPAQDTAFQLTFAGAETRAQAQETRDTTMISWRWDGRADWVDGAVSPVLSVCAANAERDDYFLRNWGPDYTGH